MDWDVPVIVMATVACCLACGGGDWEFNSDYEGGDSFTDAPPRDDRGEDPFGGPSERPSATPSTGNRWEPVDEEDACGRTRRRFQLVDEICGSDGQMGDPAGLQVTMFRDGRLLGGSLYAVDATHMWALDARDPAQMARRSLRAGPGQPLALEIAGDKLLVASGGEGLWRLEVSEDAPPYQDLHIPVPGFALDVALDGDTGQAWVAAGPEGLVAVALGDDPGVVEVLGTGALATSAHVDAGRVYVTTCEGLEIFDAQTRQRLGAVALPGNDGARLLAPGRDVVVVEGVAFIAAGRYGVVAVDVADPALSVVLGNCTEPDDPAYYASGIKRAGDKLVVAAGEWGIQVIEMATPGAACLERLPPRFDADGVPIVNNGTDDTICSTDPPWEVQDWQTTWSRPWTPPPQRGRDPIQVMVDGELVYAFGDARRLGVRAIEVKTLVGLESVGRYEEPRRVLGVAAGRGRVLALGPGGGLFERREGGALDRLDLDIPEISEAVEGLFLPDGRWVLTTHTGDIVVEGVGVVRAGEAVVWPGSLVQQRGQLIIPSPEGLVRLDPDTGVIKAISPLGRVSAMPVAVAARDDVIFAAAPEWTSARQLQAEVEGQGMPQGFVDIVPHGAFDEDDIMDIGKWRQGIPRRMLLDAEAGLVEVASLAEETTLMLHGADSAAILLPRGRYLDGAAQGARLVLVATDSDRYTSQLVVASLGEGGPHVEEIQIFVGAARGVAIDGEHVYVADADRGLRLFTFEPGGGLRFERVVEMSAPLEVAP